MKKFVCLVMVCLLPMLLMSGCSSSASGTAGTAATATANPDSSGYTSSDIQLDLSTMSGTVIYSMISNMLAEPDQYVGQIVRIAGYYNALSYPEYDIVYHSCIVPDATACCAQGLEFIWRGEHTYPFLFGLFKSDPLINVKRFTDPFIEFSKVTEEDWVAYYENHEMLPGSKEGYRWLNKLYNAGLMPDGWELDDGAIADKNRVLGYTGFFTEQPDQPWRTDRNFSIELKKNVGEQAEWISVNCFANIEDGRTLHDVYQAAGLSVFIPWWVDDQTAIAAVKYLDWMAEPANMFFLQNGVEGKNYEYLDEAGLPVGPKGTDLVEDEYKMHAGDICFIANGLWFGDMETSNAYIARTFPGFEALVEESYADAYTDTWTDISVTVPLDAVTDYNETVKVKQGEFLSAVVTCSVEDFDAVYDQQIQNILDAGADKVIEARRGAYQEGNWRGTFPYAK